VQVVLAILMFSFTAFLVVGAVTGRVRVTNCCSIADPRHDARMRSAFEEPTPAAGEGDT
jgi:hypothetical protein